MFLLNVFIPPELATFVYMLEITWYPIQWFQNFAKLTCQLVSLNKIHKATEFSLLHSFSLFDSLFKILAPGKFKLRTNFEIFPKLMSNHNCSSSTFTDFKKKITQSNSLIDNLKFVQHWPCCAIDTKIKHLIHNFGQTLG